MIAMPHDSFARQFSSAHLTRLASLTAAEPVFTADLDDLELRNLAEVEVLLTSWGSPRLDSERLSRLPNLRIMLHCAGSIKGQVSDSFWDRGLRVSSAADANAIPVAEFTLAAIVFAGKKAPFLARLVGAENGVTDVHRFGERSNLNRTIGLVGFSKVGRKVAEAVRQLDGVRCLVADPYADPYEVAAAGADLVPLATMLSAVDVLSLHAPALPSTHQMIGAAELAALRDHATLINTARGSLIDHVALERECASGRLNAILDVSDPEPLPHDSALLSLPNVMVTPHIAGSLDSEIHRLTDAALDELERYARGVPLSHEVLRADLSLTA
ncbi:hydroxyacid dehydrogenase [Microbacterium sp. MAH-37]|nr:hydroxyacid dehydrogenase [Microbacterium sp. MAH-37]